MLPKALYATAVVLIALLVIFRPKAAAQDAPSIDEIKLPNDSTSIEAMAVDGSGNVWLAQSSPAVLYEYSANAHAFIRRVVPTDKDVAFKGMSVDGSDYVLMADGGGNQVLGYDMAKDRFFNFTFPPNVHLDPSDVVGQDHYIWVGCNAELGRIDINTNNMKDYLVDKNNANLADLIMDRKGNIWFVEYNAGKLGGYIRMNDQVELFPIPTADSYPTSLGIDSRDRLWFIESRTNKLGVFDTGKNTFREIDMPMLNGTPVHAKQLAVDADDNVWITDMANGRLVKYYPVQGVFVPIPLNGSKMYPTLIDTDNNNVWFMESGANTLAMLQADPLYGLNPTPTPTATPTATPIKTPTPTPKPSPGLGILAGLVALAIVARKVSR